MINNVKKLYMYASVTNDIFEQTFGNSIVLTGFDDLLVELQVLSDVDVVQASKLITECNSWIDYLINLNILTKIYLDRFKNVQEFQNVILESIKKDKQSPLNLLKTCKIKSVEIGDVISEVMTKETETTEKVKTIKIFIQLIDSYISYLTAIFYKLSAIIKKHNSRYWNTI